MSRLSTNLSKLATGSVLAQFILAASTPLLTRLFTPELFGVVAIFNAAYALLIPIVTLKYDQAVILPNSEKSAASIGVMVMFIATINCLLIGLAILIWQNIYEEKIEYSFIVLPAALWLGAAYTLMQQWSSRISNYTHFARSQFISSITNVIICVTAAKTLTPSALHMVLGITLGIGTALVYTVIGLGKCPYKPKGLRYQKLKRQIRIYSKFPALVLPTALVTVVGVSGVPIVISHYYSLHELGLFAVANRVLLIPAAIIGGALAEVVRSEFAARQRIGQPMTPLYKKLFIPTLALSGVSFTAILVTPVNAFEFVFGQQYVESAGIAHMMLLSTLSQFICAPFMYVFAIIRRPAKGLIGQILFSLVPLCALIVFSHQEIPLKTTLFIYSLFTLGGAAIMLALVYKGCKQFDGIV